MICKMLSRKNILRTLEYHQKEGSTLLGCFNLNSQDIADCTLQILKRQQLFEGRAKNLVAHIIISPSVGDGRQLTQEEWKILGCNFLAKANLHKHQSLMYLHKDKDHHHLHIAVSRIDEHFRITRLGNERALSQRLADEQAVEWGRQRASQTRRKRYQTAIDEDIKNLHLVAIGKELTKIIESNNSANTQFEAESYFLDLESHGYEVKKFYAVNPVATRLTGYAIKKDLKRFINASTLGVEFTLPSLRNRRFLLNRSSTDLFIEKYLIKVDLEESLELAIRQKGKNIVDDYFAKLKTKGFELVLHQSKKNKKTIGYSVVRDSVEYTSSEIAPHLTIYQIEKLRDNKPANRYEIVDQETTDRLTREMIRPVGNPAKELIREIDKVIITEIVQSTVFHQRFNSIQDFFKSVRKYELNAHLRFANNTVVGYTIHRGTQSYHDDEIAKGELSLANLLARDFVKVSPVYTRVIGVRFQYDQPSIGKQPAAVEKTVSEFYNYSLKKNKCMFTPNEIWDVLAIKNLQKVQLLELIGKYKKWKREQENYPAPKSYAVVGDIVLATMQTLEQEKSFKLLPFFDKLSLLGYEVITKEKNEIPSLAVELPKAVSNNANLLLNFQHHINEESNQDISTENRSGMGR